MLACPFPSLHAHARTSQSAPTSEPRDPPLLWEMASSDDFFTYVRVRELQPDDYYLGSRTPTMLKSKDTTIILFYLPSDPTSVDLKDIWAQLSVEVGGVSFAACNGSRQTEIMKAYVETGGNPDHPLFPFRVSGFPTIMVYRQGWPQAFYNGDRSYDQLLAYALELAWKTGYYEPNNIYEGVAPSRPDLVAYEGRTAGNGFATQYIEQLSEREPLYTPSSEPGVLLTEQQANLETANVYGGGSPTIQSEDVY
jgi:hypothetical protein